MKVFCHLKYLVRSSSQKGEKDQGSSAALTYKVQHAKDFRQVTGKNLPPAILSEAVVKPLAMSFVISLTKG